MTNVAVGTGLIIGFGADYVTPPYGGTIVYALARSRGTQPGLQPRTKEVPPEWHDNIRRVFEVQNRIRSSAPAALLSSFILPGSYDDPVPSMTITALDEGVRDFVGGLEIDLQIDITIMEGIPPRPDDRPRLDEPLKVADLEDPDVPGGFLCATDLKNGTLAPAVYDRSDGSRYFATSNHLYGEGGGKETEHRGERLILTGESRSRQIGRVRQGYPAADFVQVTPTDGYQPVSELAQLDGMTVTGQYTKLGLADLMARGEKLEKVGAVSGRTTGEIKGIDGITCYTGPTCRQGQLKWGGEESMTDGDSGSVNYHPDPLNPEEEVLVGGVNNARSWWPADPFNWGTAAHHLLDTYDLHF